MESTKTHFTRLRWRRGGRVWVGCTGNYIGFGSRDNREGENHWTIAIVVNPSWSYL
jgi:hypothetical protein